MKPPLAFAMTTFEENVLLLPEPSTPRLRFASNELNVTASESALKARPVPLYQLVFPRTVVPLAPTYMAVTVLPRPLATRDVVPTMLFRTLVPCAAPDTSMP